MRLGPDELAVLRSIEDEAIVLCRDARGRVDHLAAAFHRRDALADLESAGLTWASTVRDSAEHEGHRKAISGRVKAAAVRIPSPAGAVTLPAAYSLRRSDGGQQMALWYHLSLDDLADLIDAMERKGATLTTRALAMRYGLDLARKHEATTAAEGFKAEGIDIPGIAA